MSSRASDLISQAGAGFSTWRTDGLGNPTIYPNDYLFYAIVFVIAHVVSPVVVLAAILLGVALLVVAASRALPNATDNSLLQFAVTDVLLFNPWTYTELVAGHLTMLLSYAATAYVVAEASKGRAASIIRICLAMLIVAQQLQFLLIGLLGCIILWALLDRWQPFVTAVFIGIPVWIGLAFGYRELLQIPYTLAWERDQSLHLLAAFQLRGYFAQYDVALGRLATISSTLAAVLACAAAIVVRTRAALSVALALLVVLLAVSGTNSPAAPLYEFVVTHVKATGVFRELYDLVAYLVIGYVLLVALAARRAAWMAPLLALAGLGLLASWIIAPPTRFWVASSALPPLTVDAPPDSRFALMPAFQPLRFRGQGSGADPNTVAQANNVTPINSYLPSYPAVTALARYVAGGDTSLLRGLSVSEILERPWLCTDVASLRAQTSSHGEQRGACGERREPLRLPFTAEFTVQPRFAIGTLDTNVGSGNLLLQDAVRAGILRDVALYTVVPRSLTSGVDAAGDWVDARLFFASKPELGQPYGGVYTRSSLPMPVVPGEQALVLVKGALVGLPGDTFLTKTALSKTANGYRWIAIPRQVRAVRCIGACVIAAQATSTFGYPLNPSANGATQVTANPIFPWLWRAQLPPLTDGMLLRLNVAYTDYWKLLDPNAVVRHVRVDGALNGWVVQGSSPAHSVYVIEARSCALQLSEFFIMLVLAAWGIVAIVKRAGRRHV